LGKIEAKFGQMCWDVGKFGYLYTCSKNDVISSVRKYYCALGLGLELELEFELELEIGLGLGF